MKLNLKWCPENQKIKIEINETDKFFIVNNFTNVFNDEFIKFLLNHCNTLDDLKENKITVNEEDFENQSEEIKNSISVLKEILQEFINGLNLEQN